MSIVRGGAPAFLANIRLGLKGLPGTLFIVFSDKEKSFKSSGRNVVKLFTPFIY
jgi:hypothetical protein